MWFNICSGGLRFWVVGWRGCWGSFFFCVDWVLAVAWLVVCGCCRSGGRRFVHIRRWTLWGWVRRWVVQTRIGWFYGVRSSRRDCGRGTICWRVLDDILGGWVFVWKCDYLYSFRTCILYWFVAIWGWWTFLCCCLLLASVVWFSWFFWLVRNCCRCRDSTWVFLRVSGRGVFSLLCLIFCFNLFCLGGGAEWGWVYFAHDSLLILSERDFVSW